MPVDHNCVQAYPRAEYTAPQWEIEKVEQIWDAPLGSDLILVGGVDGFGWARACRVPGNTEDIFEGEYRDPGVWYRGRFRLETEEAGRAPADALTSFYASHFDYPNGLILMPVADLPPPIKTLRLVPIDADGYATPPLRE